MAIKFEDEEDLLFVISSIRRAPIPAPSRTIVEDVFPDLPDLVDQRIHEYDDGSILIEINFVPLYNALVAGSEPLLPFFKKVDDAADGAAQVIALGFALATRNLKKFVIGSAFQRLRIARLARLQARSTALLAASATVSAGLKTSIRASRLDRRVVRKGARLRAVKPRAVRNIKVIGGVKVLTKLLRPIIVLAIIADVVLIVHRAGKGGQDRGIAGALGGVAGGTFDAVTLSLAEGFGRKIETAVGDFIESVLGSFSGGLFGSEQTGSFGA